MTEYREQVTVNVIFICYWIRTRRPDSNFASSCPGSTPTYINHKEHRRHPDLKLKDESSMNKEQPRPNNERLSPTPSALGSRTSTRSPHDVQGRINNKRASPPPDPRPALFLSGP